MVCFSPLDGWKSKEVSKTGKRQVVFNIKEGFRDLPIQVPCRQCTGCRLDQSREWAVRCVNEARMYEQNCFITLTYNEEKLPEDEGLQLDHVQRFMKRLRKKVGKKLKYFSCGEYGDKNLRPHYHMLLFNYDFDDKKYFRTTKNGDKLYTSQKLDDLWIDTDDKKSLGFATLGELTFKSAGYTARYCLKKRNGIKAFTRYAEMDYVTGKVIAWRKPDYSAQSNGLGLTYLKKYLYEVYPDDFIIVDGVRHPPPKFYDEFLQKVDPDLYKKVVRQRTKNRDKRKDDLTDSRLWQRMKVAEAKKKLLVRTMEQQDYVTEDILRV